MRRKLHLSSFPDRLKERRKSLGITQAELAAEVGTSVKTINSWESESPKEGSGPKASNIISLCNALDCSFDYLFGASESPTEQHCLALEELGLSYEAVDHLRDFALSKRSKIPAYSHDGKQLLDFYSLFLSDHGITNVISYYADKKRDIERGGPKETDIDTLYSEENIYDFMQFLLSREIIRFINDFFKKQEQSEV